MLHDLFAPAVWPWAALVFGLVVGSFANVCIHRLPRGESVGRPPSRCPSCGTPVRPYDNVPVLSWIALRARCRSCRAPISARYPLVEAANGILYFLLARRGGPTAATFFDMALVTALIVLSLIDLDHQILPDVITLPGIVLGLARAAVVGGVPALTHALIAAAAAFAAFALVAAAARRYYGEDALGMGDWKLAAMLGAFLGGYGALLTVFLGSLLGSVVGLGLIAAGRAARTSKVPIGTFLGLAGIVVVMAGDPLVRWYRGFLRG